MSGKQPGLESTRRDEDAVANTLDPATATTTSSRNTRKTSRSKTTSSTTSGFGLQALKNGVLPAALSRAPENIETLRQRLRDAPRATASPTQSMYEEYVESVNNAVNESTMMVEASSTLLKKYPSKEGYVPAYNQAFTGFPVDAGLNNGLSPAQPDFVQGLTLPQYLPFPVDTEIRGAALYKDTWQSLVLPHIAGEWKGAGKDMEQAKVQSAYDGASLVYGRQQALEYLDKPDPQGHAGVTTFTTDGANLHLFAHYAESKSTHKNRIPDNDQQVQYHQYPITSTNLTSSHAAFKEGYRTVRNAQDQARSQSLALRDGLQEQWSQIQQHKPRGDYRSGQVGVQNSRRNDAIEETAGSTAPVVLDEQDESDEGVDAVTQEHPRARNRAHRPERQKQSRAADKRGAKHGEKGKDAVQADPLNCKSLASAPAPGPQPTRRSSRLVGKNKK